MPLGLTTSEWLDLAVAGGTLALAAATFFMALFVRSQARESRRLADLSERQVAASTTPVLRIMGMTGTPGEADIVTVNVGTPTETLTMRLENRGPVAAEVEQIAMTPGGEGRLADTGKPETPVIEPNGEWDVDFRPSQEEKEALSNGVVAKVVVTYVAVGSGRRYAVATLVQREDAEHERWFIRKRGKTQELH
jgi:hypothetical protein